MKLVSTLFAVFALAPSAALAQWGGYSARCYTDYFGTTRCSSNNGSSIRSSTDSFGNTRTHYNTPYGSATCTTRTDYFGNTRTNCY
jgi:hypothetical protein